MTEQTGNQPGMVNNTGQTLPTGQVPTVPTQVQPVQAQTPQQIVQQPVVTPPPATLPPAPQALVVPPTPSQLRKADPNVDMDRKFNHLRGEVNARVGEWQTWQGQVEQVNRGLAQDLTTAQQAAATATEQLQRAQGFEQLATQAQVLALQNDRLARLIRYPVILQQRVVQQVVDEQGQTQNVETNPYMDLLMNSNLQGDQFEQAVQRLASSLQPQQAQVQPQPQANVPLGTNPQQPVPPQQIQHPVQSQQPQQGVAQNTVASLSQALPNVGPTQVSMNQGLAQQQIGVPGMVVTPPLQPMMTAQQRVTGLEQQRDEAMDAGDTELFRQLEDQIGAAKRELAQ